MKHAEYQTKVETVIKELRDGAILEETAVITLRALESVYDRGVAKESLAALSANNSCCKTEEEDPIDPQALLEEYIDLPDDALKMHFTACKEALFRRMGSVA